ncbi:GumC family protein [Pontibacter virosus]|uniref:non-specific protein-tyrosine kinase n=1 Tax=Pontibacter virosus TaxID=1765052 RepID=A0A2U1AQI8_9BACT|nr:tyrosine-protein kinase [Pontibacter virosus]PVY38682.1 capsular exopolysaccharide synthesis family protein [Pontibacter virosus]
MREKELFPLKSEQPEPKDIKEILGKYLRYWYLFLFGGVLGIGGAYFYCLYYTIPQYSISSTILLKGNQEESDGGGFGDFSIMRTSNNINNEIEVLYALSLMQRVVRELDLSTSYWVEGTAKSMEIYGKDVPIKVIVSQFDSSSFGKSIFIHLTPEGGFILEEGEGERAKLRFGQQVKRPYGIFTVVVATGVATSEVPVGQKIQVVFHDLKKVAQHYNWSMVINPKREDTNVLRISLSDPVPEKGKNIINKLVEVYNKEAIEYKNLQASSTIEFLDERLKYLTTELSDVEKDVEKYKRDNKLTDVNTQASQYMEQASGYNSKLSDWAIQIEILESIEDYLNSSNNQYKMVPSTLTIQDPTLTGLIAKFNELQLERERLLKNAFPDNPLVQNVTEQLNDLRGNITENLRNIKKSLIITSNNLRASSGQFESKISKVPSMERELLEINRQQAIKQNLYLYLLQKREESALSLAANISNSRIIDPAIATDNPISPDKQTFYLLGLMLGLGIPFAGIFLKGLLDTKVQTQQEVEQLTSTPILGEILHNSSPDTLVVSTNSHSPIVEMFRLIRAKLQFAAVDKENKTILVTSSMSGEGKTFFTINLGAALALSGKRVVLLELDLRNPRITEELGLMNACGLSDFIISKELGIADILKPCEFDSNLFIISSGPIPPNPAELIMSSKLTHLIEELKKSFDHIIIDTAPIGQVADAFSLNAVADSTIYIVRYAYTLKKQLKIIDSIYRGKELKNPVIVLNDAKDGIGSYGYGYGIKEIKRKGLRKLKSA